MSADPPSWARLVANESLALAKDSGAQAQILWLPILAALFIAAIFYPGVARELPIAVVDNSQSALSRELIRHVQANAGLRIASRPDTIAEAWQAMQRRDVYGALLIPAHFHQPGNRAQPEPVSFYVNTQFLLIGNMLQSEVMATVMEFSAMGAAGSLVARGIPLTHLEGALQPLPVRRSGVGNPYLNYLPFLVAAAIPCLLQIFMVLTGVRLIGREFRHGETSTWLPLAARYPIRAFSSRFLPPALIYTAVSLALPAALFGMLGWPLTGSWPLTLAAHAALVGASLGMGALLATLTTNYRLASSVAAFYAAPALAFSGITFPLFAMPAVAQFWAHGIPVTAFLRLQVEQGLRGAPARESMPELIILLVFAIVSISLSIGLLRRKATAPHHFGKL